MNALLIHSKINMNWLFKSWFIGLPMKFTSQYKKATLPNGNEVAFIGEMNEKEQPAGFVRMINKKGVIF